MAQYRHRELLESFPSGNPWPRAEDETNAAARSRPLTTVVHDLDLLARSEDFVTDQRQDATPLMSAGFYAPLLPEIPDPARAAEALRRTNPIKPLAAGTKR